MLRRALERLKGRIFTDGSWRAEWRRRGWAAPSPAVVKQACLLRNGIPRATWVETGTLAGETTRFLAGHAPKVYSIEPEPRLYAAAVAALAHLGNVELIHATSEHAFPKLLPTLRGDVNFWLDGHYSGGATHKGPNDTPIVMELKSVADHLGQLGRIAVLIDDVRLFTGRVHAYGEYPPLDFLVDRARAHGLVWHIEHDIFVARSESATR